MRNVSAKAAAPAVKPSEPTTTVKTAPVVVDLGKKTRGQVKKLRKGHGKLLDRVHDVLADMSSEGTISKGAQPVIVVVREKDRRGSMRLF